MAIIATLIAISIPAVMKAREAASRTTCSNNLRQMGIACWSYQTQQGYFPTAGVDDFAAPVFGPGTPLSGWRQDAGWGYQILPFLDEEVTWTGGAAASPANMKNALKTPVKFYFCPSRRLPLTWTYTNKFFPNAALPNEAAYVAPIQGSAFTVVPCDYAACNGGDVVSGSGVPTTTPGTGIVLSQANGRNVVKSIDVTDGLGHTLLLGEKAANPRNGAILNEDDLGYASGYSAVNLNTIRFASANLLPLRDDHVIGPTGGAFGSNHFGSWNALMADGSVTSFSYTIDPTVFGAIGTIRGQELVSDADLMN
jgi:hypothetical protein